MRRSLFPTNLNLVATWYFQNLVGALTRDYFLYFALFLQLLLLELFAS